MRASPISSRIPGDLARLFTDGWFEGVDVGGEQEYDQDRLLAAAQERMRLAPARLCDELIAEVRAFSGAAEFEDDVCRLGMEVKP